MKNIIGRESEKKKLSKILNSNEAEFLAIYGRRRVGKTFLNSIDKNYARNLDNKVKVFEEKTGTKKLIFLTMITTTGLKNNFYSEDLVDAEVVLKDLIKNP